MIKKRFLDLLCIFMVALIAALIVKRPMADLNLPSPVYEGKEPSAPRKEEPAKEKKLDFFREPVAYNALKERNIFNADGTYPTKTAGKTFRGPLPDKPYTLIGILQGEERKAVFRDDTGSIITLTIGKKWMDDYVITQINQLSVIVEKGKEKKELKLFDLTDPKRRTPAKPETRIRTERIAPQRAEQEVRPRPEQEVRPRPEREVRPRPEQEVRPRPEREVRPRPEPRSRQRPERAPSKMESD